MAVNGRSRLRADVGASKPNVGGDQQLNLMVSGCNLQESAFKDFRSPCRRPPRSGPLTTNHRAFRQNPEDRGKPGVRSAGKPTLKNGTASMALTKKGEFMYGTTSGDTQAELRSYSVANRHEAVRFASSKCNCGCRTFALQTDEEAGVAIRTCTDCGQRHLMGDSADYVEEAAPEAHECVCENEVFELMSGVSVYEGTHDVRWYYIACHCVECNLVGVFADWKCEAGDAAAFLAKV